MNLFRNASHGKCTSRMNASVAYESLLLQAIPERRVGKAGGRGNKVSCGRGDKKTRFWAEVAGVEVRNVWRETKHEKKKKRLVLRYIYKRYN